MVGQVILNIKEELDGGNAQVDISQFSDALEGAAELLLLPPAKIKTLSKGRRPSVKGRRGTDQDATGVAVAGLEEAAAAIRTIADAISEHQPDGLPSFVAGLLAAWNATVAVINSSLNTLIQQYPGISPVLTKEDHRVDQVAQTHRENAEDRDERMWEALEEVLADIAQRWKKVGNFDPRVPPKKTMVANGVSNEIDGLSPSTIYNRISMQQITEIWARQAD